MVQRNREVVPDRPRVTTESDPFGATDNSSSKKKETEENKGYVIQVDTNELLDTAVKSVVGGVATGFVMNRVMD